MEGGRAASLARARAAVARARAAVVAEPGGADALGDALGDAVAGVAGVAGGGAEVSGVVLGGGERNEARGGERNEARADAREAPADGRV